MREAVAKGLVGLDEEGRVVPALAARWIVTDDGLSYIFRLFDAKWDDGRQITAERVARLLNQRLSELRNSRLRYDVTAVDEDGPVPGGARGRPDAPSGREKRHQARPVRTARPGRAGNGTAG